MKLVKLYSVFIVLIFTSISFAQSIQLGFRFEPTLVRAQHGSELRPYRGSTGFQLNASILPVNWLAIEGRVAAVPFIDYYDGLETGLFAKLYYNFNYVFLKSVYITGGAISHKNAGQEHMGILGYTKTLNMPAFGIGIKSIWNLNVEVLYLDAGDSVVGYYYPPPYDSRTEKRTTYVKIKDVLKFGIGFSWDIVSWTY